MKTAWRGLGAALLATLLFAGCRSGGGSEAAPAATTTPGEGGRTTTSSTVPVSTAPASTAPPTVAGATESAPPVKALELFQTPSRNIACNFIEGETVECEIRDRSFTPPPKPASCEFDWGQNLAVGPDGAEFTCVSDTFREGTIPVLGYGETSRIGNVECASKEEGVTCTHVPSRHGFFVSRARYELF